MLFVQHSANAAETGSPEQIPLKVSPEWNDDTSWHVSMTLAGIQSGRRDLKAWQGYGKLSSEFTHRSDFCYF